MKTKKTLISGAATMLLAITMLVPATAASAATSSETAVIGMGKIHAKLVPTSEVQTSASSAVTPDSGVGFDGQVSMYIEGSGWHMDRWTIAGSPLAPGQCTYSAYWFPSSTIAFFGPDLCNYTGSPATYVSTVDNVTVNGNAYACSTVVGMSGKPCVYIWQ